MTKLFIFKQLNRNNWTIIKTNLIQTLDEWRDEAITFGKLDFQIEIRKLSKKRSDNQLRSYWRLIRVVKNFMNEHGNLFNDEEVSNWIKVRAGHYQEIKGEKIPKSIANKSSCTVEQMRTIIEFILAFGIEYNIQDCYIRDEELEDLLKFYQH